MMVFETCDQAQVFLDRVRTEYNAAVGPYMEPFEFEEGCKVDGVRPSIEGYTEVHYCHPMPHGQYRGDRIVLSYVDVANGPEEYAHLTARRLANYRRDALLYKIKKLENVLKDSKIQLNEVEFLLKKL